LAARRAGIKTFVLPKKNESDLQEIPKRLRQDLEFVLVERMPEILDVVLLPLPGPTQKRKRAKPTPLPASAVPPA
jgi:ATP-dependent Lon protease